MFDFEVDHDSEDEPQKNETILFSVQTVIGTQSFGKRRDIQTRVYLCGPQYIRRVPKSKNGHRMDKVNMQSQGECLKNRIL